MREINEQETKQPQAGCKHNRAAKSAVWPAQVPHSFELLAFSVTLKKATGLGTLYWRLPLWPVASLRNFQQPMPPYFCSPLTLVLPKLPAAFLLLAAPPPQLPRSPVASLAQLPELRSHFPRWTRTPKKILLLPQPLHTKEHTGPHFTQLRMKRPCPEHTHPSAHQASHQAAVHAERTELHNEQLHAERLNPEYTRLNNKQLCTRSLSPKHTPLPIKPLHATRAPGFTSSRRARSVRTTTCGATSGCPRKSLNPQPAAAAREEHAGLHIKWLCTKSLRPEHARLPLTLLPSKSLSPEHARPHIKQLCLKSPSPEHTRLQIKPLHAKSTPGFTSSACARGVRAPCTPGCTTSRCPRRAPPASRQAAVPEESAPRAQQAALQAAAREEPEPRAHQASHQTAAHEESEP